MLWAWERPEDLRFLDCRKGGVAFLATTITLDDERMEVRPRLQPIQIPKGCKAVATARIEASGTKPETPAEEVATEIAKLGYGSRVAAVQVDFDATVSQRGYYREVLHGIRKRLPEDVRLSMTALASWCLHDNWIEGLPVDEAVPMLFRMGANDGAIRRHLEQGREFQVELCQSSLGLSTDEPRPRAPAGRRWYVFHPEPWTRAAANNFFSQRR